MKCKFKIGVDIEKVNRFRLSKDNKFLVNNFTPYELDYAFSRAKPEIHLCGFFCAKEALIKTMESQAILLKNLEVRHDGRGMPHIQILYKGLKNKDKFLLSIAHCEDYAVANVLKIENGK